MHMRNIENDGISPVLSDKTCSCKYNNGGPFPCIEGDHHVFVHHEHFAHSGSDHCTCSADSCASTSVLCWLNCFLFFFTFNKYNNKLEVQVE